MQRPEPPEEIEVPGGKLTRASIRDIDTTFIYAYAFIPDMPMPELKPGMWIEEIDTVGDPSTKHLVVDVFSKRVDYYSKEHNIIHTCFREQVTAIYDQNEQEIWRR